MSNSIEVQIMTRKAWSNRSNRDNFQAGYILDDLAAGGKIGEKEAKRLLEEGCHAYIRLLEKLRDVNAHSAAIVKVTENV